MKEYISSNPLAVEQEAQRTLTRLLPRIRQRLTGFDHRRFLNTFYTGRFQARSPLGSPSRKTQKPAMPVYPVFWLTEM